MTFTFAVVAVIFGASALAFSPDTPPSELLVKERAVDVVTIHRNETARTISHRRALFYRRATGADKEAALPFDSDDMKQVAKIRDELTLDYGASDAAMMVSTFRAENLGRLLPVLFIPGVGTRWSDFLAWARQRALDASRRQQTTTGDDDKNSFSSPLPLPDALEDVLHEYSLTLGRRTAFAVATLTEDAFPVTRILPLHPEGDHDDINEAVVKTYGVEKVAVGRMYVRALQKLIGRDPGVSLYDHWQTGAIQHTRNLHSDEHGRRRHLYVWQISVPAVDLLGWRLYDIAKRSMQHRPQEGQRAATVTGESVSGPPAWQKVNAPGAPFPVPFDHTEAGTELMHLFPIDFLSTRVKAVWRFNGLAEVTRAVTPFSEHQLRRQRQFPDGAGARD